jgi:hypothetical protein
MLDEYSWSKQIVAKKKCKLSDLFFEYCAKSTKCCILKNLKLVKFLLVFISGVVKSKNDTMCVRRDMRHFIKFQTSEQRTIYLSMIVFSRQKGSDFRAENNFFLFKIKEIFFVCNNLSNQP